MDDVPVNVQKIHGAYNTRHHRMAGYNLRGTYRHGGAELLQRLVRLASVPAAIGEMSEPK